MVRPAHHKFDFLSSSEGSTQKIAYEIGKKLKKGLLCLYGNLGSGKTTFVRGLAKSLGIRSKIQSPTFTYSRIHKGNRTLYHFDCYRIQSNDTLLRSELNEILEQQDSVIAIEWAERIQKYLPKDRIDVYFEYVGEETRRITIRNVAVVAVVARRRLATTAQTP